MNTKLRFRSTVKYGRGRKVRRTGVAAAELAVCMPVVLLLVVATLEACSMVFLKQSLSIAAYEGVRTAIQPDATASDVSTTCNQILNDRRIEGYNVAVSPSDITTMKPGEFVDVTVSAPCGVNTIVPNTFYRGKTLSVTASMMIED
jgi:Flp pilus assembly protein TadG